MQALKSNFNKDLKSEQIVAEYMDKYFYPVISDSFSRNENMKRQFNGVDVDVVRCGHNFVIDEKSQVTMVNNPTPTFAFELFATKDNRRMDGWLYKDNETEFYNLIYIHNADTQGRFLSNSSEINKLESLIVSKQAVKALLDKKGLTKDYLFKRAEFLEKCEDEKYFKRTKQGKRVVIEPKGLTLFHTTNLAESPLNIVVFKNYLYKICVCASYVTPQGVEVFKSNSASDVHYFINQQMKIV